LTKDRDRERNRDRKKLRDFAESNPYSPIELAKHIDPVFLDDLKTLQFRTPTPIDLTVVFWDVSGFSALCNDLYFHPNGIADFLNQYFKMAIEIIKKYNGVLDKFMGDGILAYFGYNRKSEDGDYFNAISAALEFKRQFPMVKKTLVRYCYEYRLEDVKRIDLKCGIANGIAHPYYFSTQTRNSVILFGSTLNFASRLEGIAENDEIVVSNDLRELIKKQYELEERKIPKAKKCRIKSFEKEDVVYILKGRKKLQNQSYKDLK
jgi:class 3 adenylate cyclase